MPSSILLRVAGEAGRDVLCITTLTTVGGRPPTRWPWELPRLLREAGSGLATARWLVPYYADHHPLAARYLGLPALTAAFAQA